MKDWAEEILEQAAIASILGASGSGPVRRLSLIVSDNALEFALKAYIEYESSAIGSGPSQTKFSQWEKEIKGDFSKVLDLVLRTKPGAMDRGAVMRFHSTRNDLYHEAKPLTVPRKTCARYVRVVRMAVRNLFGVANTKALRMKYENLVRTSLRVGPALPAARPVALTLRSENSDPEAIALSIHAFHTRNGRAPSRDELLRTLSVAGHPINGTRVSVRVSEMRKSGFIERNALQLTSRGRKRYAETGASG